MILFIKQCKENTIKIRQYNVIYKYVIAIIFVILYYITKYSYFFIPVFSALFVVEIMYLMNIIKSKMQK